jgi:PKD repeat protein/photosystem II stability/assembly factor-like uncharacterized protein
MILAATSAGIFRTTDGGANWSQIITGNFKDIVFKADDPSVVYACQGRNFYRSTDGGLSFTQITSGLPTVGERGVIGVTPADPDYVYFLVTNGDSYRGLYRSTDAGLNFSLRSDTPNIMSWDCAGGSGGQAWYDLDIAVDPTNEEIVYAGGVNCFKSVDGGTTWNISSHWYGGCGVPSVHADLHVLEWNALDGRLYAGNDGGIYYTADGGTNWTEITDDMPIGQVYKIGQSATVRNKCVNGYQDNGTSTFMGSYWQFTNGGDGMECAVDHQDSSWSYSTVYFGSIYRHFDNYSDIQVCGNGLFGIDEGGAWVTPFILDENNSAIMFVGLKNIWRCTNVKAPYGGMSWSRISFNLGGSNSNDLSVLEQSPANTDILYAARYDNKLFRTDNSHAASVTWTDLTAFLPDGGGVADIECHPYLPDVVYISQNHNIYKSQDRGMTWTNISGTLPDVTFSSIAYYLNSNEGLYLSADIGVFFKDRTMADWVMFSTGLPVDASINEIEIWYHPTDAEQDVIRAGTYGRGLWESDMYHTTPVAAFFADRTEVLTGCPIDFTDMSTGVPTSWNWTFQGSTTGSSQVSNPQDIVYNTPGIYLVKLVVENEAGEDSLSLAGYITVSGNALPLISFSANDTTICPGDAVEFTDMSTYCPTGWSWSFNPSTVNYIQGTTSTSKDPVVQFLDAGYYTVTLTVTNANGSNQLTRIEYIRSGIDTYLFSEDFSEHLLPTCWDNTDNQGSGQIWRFNNPGSRTINTPTGSNGFAILDSDMYGYGNTQNADLVSPPLDFSAFTEADISFWHHFEAYAGSSGTFSYSINGGTTWVVLGSWTNSTSNATNSSYDLTGLVTGEPDVLFKWNYTGTWGWYWAVDDISITGIIPGMWTGTTSGSWATPANWSGGQAPGPGTEVTIPSTAPNWPVYNGDLTVGTNCGNVTLERGAHLTITGDLIIPQTNSFDVKRNSVLTVEGTIIR